MVVDKITGSLYELNMIKVTNLVKKFNDKVAVDNISFEIGKGEVVGFLGPNGAGKTTTLRMISGVLSETSGEIFIDDVNMSENPIEAKNFIGYMPENNPLYEDMTVWEYLNFFAELLGAPNDKIRSHIDEILNKTGLNKVSGRIIGNLSKGYKQRVGLAGALLGNPEVLILDEPTSGLDPLQIIQIRDLIRELAKERTIILSSHILSEIQEISSRVIIINNGKIVADGKADQLSKMLSGGKQFFIRLTGNKEKINKFLSGYKGVKSFSSKNDGLNSYVLVFDGAEEKLTKAILDNGFGIKEFKSQNLELEEIFVQMTKE